MHTQNRDREGERGREIIGEDMRNKQMSQAEIFQSTENNHSGEEGRMKPADAKGGWREDGQGRVCEDHRVCGNRRAMWA